MKFFFFLFFCFLFSFVFFLLCYFLSYFFLSSPPHCSSFECGFSSFLGSMSFFSMPFFIVSIMFLLFDVEILLLCFYPLHYCSYFSISFFVLFTLIFIIVLTLYEWFCGAIDWF